MTATVFEIRLLTGRYHAHVWGESQFAMASAEWPPSPWRLLRALAAAWFLARPAPSTPADRDDLLQTLGRSGPPELWLPRAAFREVRYYQPIRLGGSDRALHHDQFAIPEGGRFWLAFGTEISHQQRSLLVELLRRIRYLGRAESRATVTLADVFRPPAGTFRVLPHDHPDRAPDAEYRDALCPSSDFLAPDLWSLRDAGGGRTRGSRKKSRPSADAYPIHLVDELLRKKKPIPDGTHWVTYALPRGSLVPEIPTRPAPKPRPVGQTVPVSVIRFALQRRTPIPLLSLVLVARAFRNQVVQNYAILCPGVHSVALTGLDRDGLPARGHAHVYYVPRLAPGQRRVDRLDVLVPGKRLTRSELEALLSVERVRLRLRDPYPITVVAEAIETQVDADPSITWQSASPFLPPLRHRNGRRATIHEQQLARLLEQSCGLAPVEIRITEGRGGSGSVTQILSHDYGSGRRSAGQGGSPAFTRRSGFWFLVRFPEPVSIEYPVGADAHFGLGQFVAC